MDSSLFYLVNEIHSTVVATSDAHGNPVTCVIDMMDCDENGLYFLTAKGKGFYKRLYRNPNIAISGMKGCDTMHTIAVSVRGTVREIGTKRLSALFRKNPYMNDIYPDEASRAALTVFQVYEGTGEQFNLSVLPPERREFAFGGAKKAETGYFVTDLCSGCSRCYTVCPQKSIDTSVKPVQIDQTHCIRCGNCFEICPEKAIVKKDEP